MYIYMNVELQVDGNSMNINALVFSIEVSSEKNSIYVGNFPHQRRMLGLVISTIVDD